MRFWCTSPNLFSQVSPFWDTHLNPYARLKVASLWRMSTLKQKHNFQPICTQFSNIKNWRNFYVICRVCITKYLLLILKATPFYLVQIQGYKFLKQRVHLDKNVYLYINVYQVRKSLELIRFWCNCKYLYSEVSAINWLKDTPLYLV